MLLTCVEVELVAVGGFVVELPVRKRDVRTGWVGVLLAKAKAPEEVEGVRQVLRSIRTLLGLTSVAITISATVDPKRHSQGASVDVCGSRNTHESAIVVKVVADEHVVDRGGRRRALERWMVRDHTRDAVEATVAVASDPNIAVVVRHVVDQPFNRVVCVATLVHVMLAALLINVWRHMAELALGAVAPTHIL